MFSELIRTARRRKEREQELESAKRELERSNEKLDQFGGMVSHDLRNPLNVIKTRAELLRTKAPAEHVEPIENSVKRMETMIEDLLTLSRAGDSVDDPESIFLATVVADSWAAVSSDGLELEVDIPDDIEVAADGDRLRHVFENLFCNAREHNDPPVTIRVGTLTDETGAVSGFFIADDGTGIPESGRAEVFEQGYTTNRDGTGFGLSIVEGIVEAHGWTISVGESDAGGARFDVHTVGQK
jgi:signal transduction histidine kinase